MQAHKPNADRFPDKHKPYSVKDVARHCGRYQGADTKRSAVQLCITLVLFFSTCGLMLYGANFSYWIVVGLILPAAGLLTRIFIFQHDCGHGSFWNSKKANDWTGRFLSILTVTPYYFWRRAHNLHHATSGDLDRRSVGGIETITVREYQALTKWKKRAYRLYRNPLVLLVFGTPFYTLICQRIPFNQSAWFYKFYKPLPPSSVWKSIMLTNVAIAVFYGMFVFVIGWGPLLSVYLPILIVTAWIGGWLFYIQHQFEDTYWKKSKNWNFQEAALAGSSYYVLPRILQWFTGNIGLHHIHHLCNKIPNYKLQECMDARPELQAINRLTLHESLGCMRFKLWDEETSQLVPFSAAY